MQTYPAEQLTVMYKAAKVATALDAVHLDHLILAVGGLGEYGYRLAGGRQSE
jgi:hypothetical protein